jgi:hypothetical protein
MGACMLPRLSLLLFLSGFLASAALAARPDFRFLDQGWGDAERQEFYYQSQGSLILPYDWFLALEQPWSEKLFRDSAYLESFGYMPDHSHARNSDGLPVGFAKGKDAGGREWFGFSCAACHTGQLTYRGSAVRVDGGTTLADVLKFQSNLALAVRATLDQPKKLARFARRLGTAPEQVEPQLRERWSQMTAWQSTSRPAHGNGGYGTWDAVNILMNTVDATALSEPSNNRVPEVPVSYPSIWLTTQLDWLLWNASIQNSMVRAVGEVIIVFGQAKVTSAGGKLTFSSSADIPALDRIYHMIYKLKPPPWPGEVFGAIDAQKAEQGARIYEREGCVKCHANKPPYPMTKPDASGHSYIQIAHTPLAEVGTDPDYAQYFVQRTAIPSIMAPAFKGTALEGLSNIPASLLFLATLTQITATQVDAIAKTPAQREDLLGNRPLPTLPKTKAELDGMVQSLLSYKAAPLAGVWSTAPYLHNGSVPTLYDLLSPPEKRPKLFYLGDHEFDPRKVGYQSRALEGVTSAFDTAIPGQSNAGHSYGTGITEDERLALLEYLKTL